MAEDQYLTCPFNASHQILAHRFDKHLVKCQQSYNGPKLLKCPYNFSHRFLVEDKEDHLENCPSKKAHDLALEENRRAVEQDMENDRLIRIHNVTAPASAEDDWMVDDFTSGYDPQVAYENVPFVRRVPPNLSKAGKKAYYESERVRIQQLKDSTGNIGAPSTDSAGGQMPCAQNFTDAQNLANDQDKSGGQDLARDDFTFAADRLDDDEGFKAVMSKKKPWLKNP